MCDVDGTLLNDEGFITPKTIEAIRKLRTKGILFGLCTGRDVHSVHDLLDYWGLANMVDAIAGTVGAEICDLTCGVETSSYPLDGALIIEIIRHYEHMDVNFAIPYHGILYAPKEDSYIQMLAKADHLPYQVVDFDSFLQTPKPKVMIVCDKDDMEAVIEHSKSFDHPNYTCASLKTASVLYEYMDPRISKTHGLEQILALHEWTMENLCTFGDADNDYDMTLHAGIGVVMENGSEKTKSVVNALCDDNNHDGIAAFLNTYLL